VGARVVVAGPIPSHCHTGPQIPFELADHFKERHELDRFKFTDKLPRPLLRQPADGGHLCTVRVVTASLLYPSPKLDDARLPGQRTMARPSQCVDYALLKSAKEVGMPAPSPDPMAILRSRTSVRLLVLAAVLGVPISAVAYGFLALVASLQDWLFSDLPKALGFDGAPRWWPLPMLTLAGVLGALIIRYLPGNGGLSPVACCRTARPASGRRAACQGRAAVGGRPGWQRGILPWISSPRSGSPPGRPRPPHGLGGRRLGKIGRTRLENVNESWPHLARLERVLGGSRAR
jgi:hypothetical protein